MMRFGLTLAFVVGTTTAQAHWTQLYTAQTPSPREFHAMATEPGGGILLFGGEDSTGRRNDIWRFRNNAWQQVFVGTRPSPRYSHAMAFDRGRGVVVLFGGNSNQGGSDTWEWNGFTWAGRNPTSQPSPRTGHAMAYDHDRGVSVLFGGQAGNSLNDTWEWNGSDWLARSSPNAPGARRNSGLAYDPTAGGLILFGGIANNQPLFTDTWRWNGAAWQQLQPGNSPIARATTAMISDLDRGRIVLWGGSGFDTAVWEWDGSNWHMHTLTPPSPRSGHALAYDEARRRTISFAGRLQGYPSYGDTWTYATPTPARFETAGPGCTGSSGQPELRRAGFSLPWVGDVFESAVTSTPASAATIFATGFEAVSPTALDPFGMPGCNLFVTLLETQFRIASSAGVATWDLRIPNSPTFAGVELAQQVLVLDPGVNAAGAVVSNAARFVVGIR
ncbi:MAG: kelch repeat-containing protein [bacterium]|nr:kelch repeat-containing protein [bacterium]